MELTLSGINRLAVALSVIAGPVVSTVWFVALFGEPWAKEYGATSKRQHTKEVPGYTYAVQVPCTIVMVLSVAALQRSLGVASVGDALKIGLFVAI